MSDIEICFGKGSDKNSSVDENFHCFRLFVNSIDDMVDIDVEDSENVPSEEDNFIFDNICENQFDVDVLNFIDFVDVETRPILAKKKAVDTIFLSPAASSSSNVMSGKNE